MALEQILTLASISADCGTQNYTDDTVYGGAEFDRNEVAVIVTAQKTQLPSEADVPLVITGNDNDPETDVSWIVVSQYDGWHTLPMYIVPIYNAATAYTVGQVVWFSGTLWICIQGLTGVDPGSDPAYWTAINITDDKDDVEAADNVQFDYFNFIPTCRGNACASKATALAAEDGCCGDCDNQELKQVSDQLDLLLNAVNVKCNQLKYAEGEEIVRNITHICEKSKCICD